MTSFNRPEHEKYVRIVRQTGFRDSEFTQRAFLNGKMDLLQADGVIDLIDAATAQAARCALRSLPEQWLGRA